MFNTAAHHSAVSAQTGGLALDSRNLLRGNKTVTIVHNGASYRLQATKLGKLILTK
ncbi:hemin uptake protein HemP [Oryzisolibacter sp. LB2S]|uniref:hemin uptake protein HemP n=1 Tax=Alicycliphilus soli TaxID=3228789 RepID=UPI003459F092